MTKFRRMGRLIAASTTTAVALSVVPFAAAQENTVEFSVSNITDFHGHLEPAFSDPVEEGDELGAANLASLIEYVNRDEEYVMTTSGDNVGGSAFVSAITDDQFTIDFLNAIDVQASAVGNHEFDRGMDDLTGRIQPESDFPILGANVYRGEERVLDASHVVELESGVRVGFVGTVTQATATKVSPAAIEGITFTDPVEATNDEATRLKESGEADVVIALMHEDASAFADGFNADVDALFGGDSHQRYVDEIEREGALPLAYAQGHEYGKVLNDMDFTFDLDSGELVNIEVAQYDATDFASLALEPDAEVEATVADAKAQADEAGQEVVAEIEHSFTRGSNPGADSGSNRGVESTLNNLIAEATRASMENFTGRNMDLGLMNAGGVRDDLAAGEITYQEAFNVQPFGNDVAYATMTGQAIINALENQWVGSEDHARLALGVSDNFSYTYDPTAPQGERVIGAMINGEPLDPDTEYTVAASTFLFEGGDALIGPAEVQNLVNAGVVDVQAFIDYLESNPDVTPRSGQADVGVSVEGDLVAGETVTVHLSSLNYSSEGEPMADEVTVQLGSASVNAPIDTSTTEADAGFGEFGRATVELTIPEDYTGEPLIITTDTGTDVVAPLEAAELPDDGDNGADNGSSAPSLSSEEPAAGFLGLITGALAGLAAALGIVQFFVPNVLGDIQTQINALIGR
ncbi:bifunctional metallophosphatase/5'-nucleotidase [Corynebacterium halotolerans]|uniref:5'-nucleotidase n=1 Tax=Corynebacterium halotolerans YIM 70093 = DSM 44683 TaxID=1121362 RepID=M1NYN2_9CORY|nr:bifunctional UDP-sugar hydrolase/5'-nucleotidase [Corynebacterium halotolerans]AGF72610.1 5'-nucleotidase [Corynebacterium halotolerans YIM 70093 = DSM 44683]